MSNLNFPRMVILLGLLASGILGYFVYEKTEQLKAVEDNLQRAPKLVSEIQTKALELNQLNEKAANNRFKGIGAAESYIREICADPKVGVGQVTTKRREKSRSKTVKDDIIEIDPASRDRAYSRSQIGNFLYQLEAKSPLVRVTGFNLKPINSVKPGEIGDDRWTFSAELTSRTKTEG